MTLLSIAAIATVFSTTRFSAYAADQPSGKITDTPQTISDQDESEEPEPIPISINDCKITINKTTYAYTGSFVKPQEIKVVFDDHLLIKDKDYTISYFNNKKVGYKTAGAKITGIGNYTGSVNVYYSIIPQTNNSMVLSTSNDSIRVNWAEDSNALAYQILYSTTKDFSSNVHSTTVQGKNYVNLSRLPAAGERWYVKLRSFITDNGTTSGKRAGTYGPIRSILVKDNIRSVTIPYCSYTYSGKAIKPSVKVKGTNGVLLTEGKDYTVAYSNNVKVGTATITITGKGNIQGKYIKKFIVKPKRNAINDLYTTKKGTFTASWNADSTASGYQVLYSTDPNCEKNTYSYSTKQTKITFSKNPQPGKTYYVKVRSYLTANGTRYGNYSAVKTIPLMQRDIDVLKNSLASAIKAYPGSWSVYVKNLRTQEYLEINNRKYYAASLMKLYCMAATYEAIEKGKIKETAEINRQLKLMITISSDDAFNRLLHIIGKTAVRDWINRNGYTETEQYHGYAAGYDYPGTVIAAGYRNKTTAKDCAKFFESVYKGECVSKAASQKMMNLLKAQQVRYKAPAAIPKGIQTANKTGDVKDNAHDCMLVFLNNDPYIISVMSEIPGRAWDNAYHVTDLSRITYNFFSRNTK